MSWGELKSRVVGRHRGDGIREAVQRECVGHRADNGQLVGPLGQPRKMLANLQAGHLRGDRLEFAANLRWRGRLHVPGVLMRRPAPHEEQNARLGSAKRAGCLWASQRPGGDHLGQRQAQQAQRTGAQNLAAIGNSPRRKPGRTPCQSDRGAKLWRRGFHAPPQPAPARYPRADPADGKAAPQAPWRARAGGELGSLIVHRTEGHRHQLHYGVDTRRSAGGEKGAPTRCP